MSDFEYKVKRENPNDEFVILSDWAVQSGDKVSEGDYLCSLEATKNSYEVMAEKDGYIFYQIEEGERKNVGELLFVISENESYQFVEVKKITRSSSKITRKAQKLIDEYSIENSVFANLEARVSEADVRKYIEENNLSKAGEEDIGLDFTEEALSGAKEFEVHFMQQARDVIYSNVTRSISSEIIKSAQDKAPGATPGEIVSFSLIEAVKKFPLVNSYFKNNKIRKFESFNLGLAINIEKGLKVPVIKDFQMYTFENVQNEFRDLAMKYFRDELTGADLSGGTFTVTDLSSFGVTNFMPVVFKDQSAILGICSEVNGSYNLVLGFDHRVMDGMYAAQFLAHVEKVIKEQ